MPWPGGKARAMFIEESGTIEFSMVVGGEDAGVRIDAYLTKHKDIPSRSFAQHLIEKDLVRVDGDEVGKDYRLRAAQTVDVEIPPPAPSEVLPEAIPLTIKFEDDDLIILSKPAGMVVHPAHGHAGGTLVNALLAHTTGLSGIGGVVRPGIVHRLDKDTSGLMIVAKNDNSHQALSGELKKRRIKRTYLTLVHGTFKEYEGTVDAPIGRSPKFRQKMSVTGVASRDAVSHYRVLETFGDDYSLVEVKLETGRTHQIRVHMRHINHPVVGDPVYGSGHWKRDLGLSRQFLHAYKLELSHPRTKEPLSFEESIPPELQLILNKLRGMYFKRISR